MTAQLKIGANAASNDFTPSFDFSSHLVTATFNAASTVGSGQSVQLSLDGTTFVTLPGTIAVAEYPTPPSGVVRETFAGGAGSSYPQQFPGILGDGWAGAWGSTSQITKVVGDTAPLQPDTGINLRVTRTGGSGSTSQEGVFRQWSESVPPKFVRLTFDIRVESDDDVFNNAGDAYSITLNSASGASPGPNSTIYIRCFGADIIRGSDTILAREWVIFDGDPGVLNGYDINRFVRTGIFAEIGNTSSFTVDIYAASGGCTPNNRTHGTYDVTVSDGTSSASVFGSGFRSAAYSAGGYLAFAAQQNTATDNLSFSIDSIEITPWTPLQLWRASYFTAAQLANPALEATLWGHLANPNFDGEVNLLEYALGTHPTTSSPAGLPAPGFDAQGR